MERLWASLRSINPYHWMALLMMIMLLDCISSKLKESMFHQGQFHYLPVWKRVMLA
ncbi:unnamed protein product [Musa acuminata subsp. malaccensis]|uniref:(wild Malaysian banana) hypothetical protein n=1 Tax=Musa acuminata subsp. malaccensis TaxID=214687 RepID=A0A804JAX8_MUSAM|nr:unnamed protein product [Musa acuminata subsp. malaccensis]